MSLQHLLMGLLDRKPLHGYALRDQARRYGWFYPMTNANIYPTLRRLEESGWILHAEEVHGGRVRKVYEITDQGRSELRRWLDDPKTPRMSVTDPALLKFSLLSRGSAARARTWLEDEMAASHDVASRVEGDLERPGAALSRYDRLALRYTLRMARLRSEWLREALDAVLGDTAGSSPEPVHSVTV